MHLAPLASLARMQQAGLSRVFTTAVDSPAYYWKQILAGVFIVLTMTGMDQEMMQKCISVKTLRDAQKNMVWLGCALAAVIALFLFLGGLLHLYAALAGVTAHGDKLFAAVVLGHLPAWVQLVFFIALISALFPSADGAITALTSSFCIDILGLNRREGWSEAHKKRWRHRVHVGFSVLFLLLVMVFKWVDSASMIGVILKVASYTYGPLLVLFAFGIVCRRQVRDGLVPLVVLAGPLLCALLEHFQAQLLGGYRLGLELLMINGLFVLAGLFLISRPAQVE